MQSLLDWKKSVQIAMQSDIQGVAKMACEDWGAWEKEDVFFEYLQYAMISLISSVRKSSFLLIVQRGV